MYTFPILQSKLQSNLSNVSFFKALLWILKKTSIGQISLWEGPSIFAVLQHLKIYSVEFNSQMKIVVQENNNSEQSSRHQNRALEQLDLDPAPSNRITNDLIESKKKKTNDLGSRSHPWIIRKKNQLNSTETKENRSRNVKRLQNDANSHKKKTNTSTRFPKSNYIP